MNRLVRTELLKLRTARTFVVGVASVPVIAALMTVAVMSLSGKGDNDPLTPISLVHAVGAPAAVITLISVMLGVVGMAGEYRHETITTTFLAHPRRRDVVLAKLLTHALLGAVMAVVSTAVVVAIAVPWLHSSEIAIRVNGEGLRVGAGLIVSSALYGALGVAVGALFRNLTVASAAVLVWLLAVEGLIGDLFFRSTWVSWLPAAAGRALVHVGSRGDQLAFPVAAVVFAAYVAVLALASVRLTLDRDVT